MCVSLENENLKVSISEDGAELTSVKGKKTDNEYIWTADSKYWGRHAPILFPIVGRVKEDKYRIDDKIYKLPQHGFARDMKFELESKTEDTAVFKLGWNEETLEKYPYKFELRVIYCLKESKIDVTYNVKNVDEDKIYFSIGAHPAFNCPVIGKQAEEDELQFEDYYIEFENRETTGVSKLNSNSLLSRNRSPFLYASNILSLGEHIFKQGALILKDLDSTSISLRNDKNTTTVTVSFEGFPYVGLWSKPEGAPFVCIEPWFGHADYEDFNGDFREKEDGLMLEAEKEFQCTYSIDIEE
ncbi:aldose 1-epimerase family protein [Clostridium felsineum]|uniref:Protein LacX, plasmid n=1 Tax=Clostridium felsineum TaxID=36839 RepID=A0A1S8L7W9_9CLOT|nr:aldose 1-epimerase family protein [Clostridium felsineum]MCR3757893.1 aldose 1-epimerase family protein [Clostridium felsineum]URZ03595.1 Protein LacX, plasmid [Clostridium felsineum]URZ08089.1 Protein LacX, plasmid [Clostridium felsineum]URZ13120.1 Protein LacX, plasmid [Clostridium felsineum]URZ14898.1 Protein LacX, plasmid [Clostridium felsineum DSM 794]